MRKEYTKDFLLAVITNYPQLGDLQDFKLFTSGYENSNFLINTTNGAWVVKVYEAEDMNRDSVEFEVQVMSASFEGGVKSPTIETNMSGQLLTPVQSKNCIVMNFIEGENMVGIPLGDDFIKQVGKEAGKMDTVLKKFKDGSLTRQNYEFDLKNFLDLRTKISNLPEEIDKTTIEDAFVGFENVLPIFSASPTGLIHNDIAAHNLLGRGDELYAIIDFSDMAFSPYVQNIAVVFAQTIFTYNWNPTQAKIFIDAYKEHHSLSESEISILYELVLARYAQLVVAFNYWNVTLGVDEQRTKYVVDNYKFMNDFIAIGRENFYRSLR